MLNRSSGVNVALAFASSPTGKALHSLDPIRHQIDLTLSIPDADKLEASTPGHLFTAIRVVNPHLLRVQEKKIKEVIPTT